MQKYSVNQHPISTILSWVQAEEIAIPEIQRPFIWSTIKVRNLMDSLYHGFPVGYIIAWKNPDVRLRDGTISSGKKILIDGQQRIVALKAAILGETVINKEYKGIRIKISFNPVTEKFETLTPAIERNKIWISDIAEFLKDESDIFDFFDNYCELNKDINKEKIKKSFRKLSDIKNRQAGFIELDADLDIETVTEIFIRINSEGVPLSQADFVMSKIASYDKNNSFGPNLRKCIDYFCHLSKEPQFYNHISENDREFNQTIYLPKIAWLKNENDDLYSPKYSDVLRVSFTKEFERGKMSELVGLLSGRNFKTKKFEQEIMNESFKKLSLSVLDFINETHFKRFLMIIKSCGFTSRNLINSQNVLNFAYILYLKLRDEKFNDGLIEKYVQKWFLMSTLTGRYSGSPESKFDLDIKSISHKGIEKYLQSIEDAELSDAFWNVGLVDALDKATLNNPFINVFFASQIKANDRGFLSKDITVANLVSHRGDIHHIFPKEYLKTQYNIRRVYNQIANFVYAQAEINIKIGKKAPKDYFQEITNQCNGGKLKYGSITDTGDLHKNLKEHCIPETIFDMTVDDYCDFLEQRKKMMAKKIEQYYKNL